MDAKITKQRLANFLSYDWLKILVAAVLAVAAVCVFFTSVRTGPTDRQTFTVYAYELSEGDDAVSFADTLLDGDTFSYEILFTQYEGLTKTATGSIFGGLFTGTTLSTRLTNTARTVMFVSGLDDTSSTGYEAVVSLIGINSRRGDGETNGYLDFQTYLDDCAEYLGGFFGDLQTGTLDEEKAEECFLSRNGSDSRFRSEAQKEEGIAQEKERLEKLRSDYLAVTAAFEDNKLSDTILTVDEEHADPDSGIDEGEYLCGVNVGRLSAIRSLFYTEAENEESGETEKSVSGLTMILFNTNDLADKTNDLRYETVSFLAYLLRTYG